MGYRFCNHGWARKLLELLKSLAPEFEVDRGGASCKEGNGLG